MQKEKEHFLTATRGQAGFVEVGLSGLLGVCSLVGSGTNLLRYAALAKIINCYSLGCTF